MSGDDTPIFASFGSDPIEDYAPDWRDVLFDQLRTITRLQEDIMDQQAEVNDLTKSINDAIQEMADREKGEAEKPPLDLSALEAAKADLEKLNSDQAARLNPPSPAATDPATPVDPAAPAVDPAGAPVDPAAPVDPVTGNPVVQPPVA